MPDKILNDDWTDYNQRKALNKQKINEFSCNAVWELDYLVKKITTIYPKYSEAEIRNTIGSCCRAIPAPHLRDFFVSCVMSALRK